MADTNIRADFTCTHVLRLNGPGLVERQRFYVMLCEDGRAFTRPEWNEGNDARWTSADGAWLLDGRPMPRRGQVLAVDPRNDNAAQAAGGF